jgi:hypothetical protein
MNNIRMQIFRGLIVMPAVLIVIAFIMPWWSLHVGHPLAGRTGDVIVYAYGLRHTLYTGLAWVNADITPTYQTILAWVFLIVSVGLMFYSTWLREKGKWVLVLVGLAYILYGVIAALLIINRTGELGFVLQGTSYIATTEEDQMQLIPIEINTSLNFGYYLIYVAGIIAIILSFLRTLIMGKAKT